METTELRSTPGGGGVARAELLDKLNVEMQVMVGHLTLVVGGVSDALDIAAQRDNQVNGPGLAYIVRPSLELAGQVAWLLTDQIAAEQRARRLLVWRLADLRAQRLLLRDFRASQDLVVLLSWYRGRGRGRGLGVGAGGSEAGAAARPRRARCVGYLDERLCGWFGFITQASASAS